MGTYSRGELDGTWTPWREDLESDRRDDAAVRKLQLASGIFGLQRRGGGTGSVMCLPAGSESSPGL